MKTLTLENGAPSRAVAETTSAAEQAKKRISVADAAMCMDEFDPESFREDIEDEIREQVAAEFEEQFEELEKNFQEPEQGASN